MKFKWLINTMAVVLLVAVAAIGLARYDAAMAAQEGTEKIEGMLLERFAAEGTADFIVRFTPQADLSPAYSMDWDARGEFVYNTLRETADRSQVNAKAILDRNGLRYHTFFAGNDLYVWSGTLVNATELAALPEVDSIRATRVYQVDPGLVVSNPILTSSWAGDLLANHALTTVGNNPTALAWGIQDTKADQFWTAFGVQGDGILVANIDTGVDYTHIALDQAYKCLADPSSPACWLDPGTADCTGPGGGPCDSWTGIYHGTHVMGTQAGDDDPTLTWQVGMAPNSQWIACMGCPSGSCPDFDLNSCADWIIAPGGDPANRPDVVNNSWGGGGGNSWWQSYVQAWVAAGVFPAFSAGNSGSGCNSLGSPGDYQESFGSAAHDSGRNIASFSSRGPSAFGDDPYTKPNLSSPGVNVMSAMPGNTWQTMSGTSMASPHTAGAVALLWSCNPALIGQIDLTFQLLQNNTDPAPAGNCGAPPDGQGNYTFGYGYLDVLQAGMSACGDVSTGFLNGHVYDGGGLPVQGATVSAAPGIEGGQIQATTDPNGYYTMTLVAGTYDVTASKLNYEPQTVNGVVIVTDTVTTQDFTINFLGAWTQLPQPSLPCPDWTRIDAELYNGLVYFLGGRGGASGGDTFGDVISYDPAANTCVDTGTNMPTPVSNYTIALVNDGTADLLCIFGGRDSAGGYTANYQCYDPVANTATTMGTLPGDLPGFIPGGVGVIDNKVYVFGGFRNTVSPYHSAQTWEWDPVTDAWTQKGNINLGRGYINVSVVDGLMYGFGGDTFDGVNLVAQTIAEVYDPVAGTWSDAAVADLPTASGEGRAYGFNIGSGYELAGKIIIAGGGQWPAETPEAFAYDIASDTYDYSFPDLNISRRNQAGWFMPGNPGAMWVYGGRSSSAGYGGDLPPYAPPEYFPVSIAVQGPVIVVDPPTLETTLVSGEIKTITMTVGNEGNEDLIWELLEGAPNISWSDNFDSYATGSQMHGQGGWKGWANNPAAGALTSDVQARSVPNSVAILGASDLVHEYSGHTTGLWTYTAWQYIPTDFAGTTYFILLNSYDDAGTNLNWSLEVSFDSATGLLTNDGPDGGTLPLVLGQWVQIRVEIDLDADTQSVYYGGDLLFTGSWTEGMSGGGVLNIAAVDLFANDASVVYYDDISLIERFDVPWLSEVPTNGTTPPAGSSPVNVTFDATGMSIGVYTTTLYAASNDLVTPMLPIPVTMTILPSADLSISKLDNPDPVFAGDFLTYTVGVLNIGPDDATGVVAVDTLPAGVIFDHADLGCTEASGVVTCDIGTLLFEDEVFFDIVVTAPSVPGVITNTASVHSDASDPEPGNDIISINTTVVIEPADLQITKTDTPDPVTVSGTLTYTLLVSNAGPNDATNVVVVDTLPDGVTFGSAQGCTHVGLVVTCDVGNLASGGAVQITIVVTAPGVEGTITNTATVSAAEPDPLPANNTATADTLVVLPGPTVFDIYLPLIMKN